MVGFSFAANPSGGSFLHRLDPRLKIIFVMAMSYFAMQINLWRGIWMSAFWALAFCASSISFLQWFRALRPMVFLFVLIFLFHLFFSPGNPLVNLPIPFPAITWEGLVRGIWLIWQLVLLVLGASLLTLTTLPSELVNGMERLLRPLNRLGVPSHDLAMMVSLALRFWPTLLEEMERMKTAQLARGANFHQGGPMERAQRIYSLALPMLIRISQRTEEIATAMEGRGYRRGPRTYLRDLHWTGRDWLASLWSLGFFALLYLS